MRKSLRGRPRLNIAITTILREVHNQRQIVAAAKKLGCSQAYIHAALKIAGLTLRDVLEAGDIEMLVRDRSEPDLCGPNSLG